MLVFGVAAFLALFAQAYDLAINQHDEMKQRAANQQMRSTVISASRGSILDRNGTILAMSASADTVFLDPRAIESRAAELETARAKAVVAGRQGPPLDDQLGQPGGLDDRSLLFPAGGRRLPGPPSWRQPGQRQWWRG